MLKNRNGFTLVELLIVIVVIAILAAISIVAYNGIQTRAKASQGVSSLKAIDKAMRLYGTEQSWSTWPLASAITTAANNPSINRMLTDIPSLKNYLNSNVYVENSGPNDIYYGNAGDVKSSCGTNFQGVNIVVPNVSADVASAIDKSIDDGDTNCGVVRYSSANSRLAYTLSYSSTY